MHLTRRYRVTVLTSSPRTELTSDDPRFCVQLLRKLCGPRLCVTVAEHLSLFGFRWQVNLFNPLVRRIDSVISAAGVTSLISFFLAAMMPLRVA